MMTRTLCTIGLVALLVGGACSTRFPYHMSLDRHNFVSSHHEPVTLILTDTVTGEDVWTLHVPAGKMAVVDFKRDHSWTAGQTPGTPAKSISWDVLDVGQIVGILGNRQELSGNPVLLKHTIRDSPEIPEDPAVAEAPVEPEPVETPAEPEPDVIDPDDYDDVEPDDPQYIEG